MPNYALLPYENNKGLLAVKTSTLITQDIEIDTLEPIVIPPGTYDGTTVVKLSTTAAAEVDAQYIAQGHSILGVNGTLVAQDNLPALLRNTLTSVSDTTLTSIGQYQFYNKTAITTVDLPSVTGLGAHAFDMCRGLTAIDFPLVTAIPDYAFFRCTSAQYADIESATSVAQRSFADCTAMTEINAPVLVNIGNNAFFDAGLVHAYFPEALTIAYDAFNYAFNMESLTLPKANLTNGHEFYNCAKLKTADFGATASIKSQSFGLCVRLDTLILRPSTVCALENTNAFSGTPFAQGGTGGTIYIPESLYNHLGDGTALDYKAATNWSVIDAYGTITWAKIEGSQYEIIEEDEPNE